MKDNTRDFKDKVVIVHGGTSGKVHINKNHAMHKHCKNWFKKNWYCAEYILCIPLFRHW